MKLLITIIFAYILASCCTKQYCIGSDDIQEVFFNGFDFRDVDSISIVSFVTTSAGKVKEDSALVLAYHNTNNRTVLNFPFKFNIKNRYELRLLSNQKMYFLDSFTTSQNTCNCPGDNFSVLKRYSSNGIVKNSSSFDYLEIEK
jgi:hypothetical protein